MIFGKRRRQREEIQAELAQAQRELAEAQEQRADVEQRASMVQKMKVRWELVHERNGLSELFLDEYRRTR